MADLGADNERCLLISGTSSKHSDRWSDGREERCGLRSLGGGRLLAGKEGHDGEAGEWMREEFVTGYE